MTERQKRNCDPDLFLNNFLKIRSRSKDDFSIIKKDIEELSVFDEINNKIISTYQDESMFWDKVKYKYLEYQNNKTKREQ